MQHLIAEPPVERVAAAVAGRHRILVLVAWGVVFLAAGAASSKLSDLLTNRFTLPGTDSQKAEQILQDSFGQRSVLTFSNMALNAGVPAALEGRIALRGTPFGHALAALLRFAWLGGDRAELYAHLRSPYSGLQRREVDWVEGKLRGRGIFRGERTIEVTAELRGGRPLPCPPRCSRPASCSRPSPR